MYQFYLNEAIQLFSIDERTIHNAMETLVKAASVLKISEQDWYAYGAASLLIACKCHELDDNLPSLEEIIVVMETSPLLEDIKYELSLTFVMKLE